MAQADAFHAVVDVWDRMRSTPRRLEKRAHAVTLFERLAAPDLQRAACWLAGEIPQGPVQVGWRTIQEAATQGTSALPLFAATATQSQPLTCLEVETCFQELARVTGVGAEKRRRTLLGDVFFRASALEREFLVGLLQGELRSGSARALVIDALAVAMNVPSETLRRAVMFAGDFSTVVQALATAGVASLERFGPRPLVPIQPMLASPASSAAAALTTLGEAAVEWKLDGVRVQLHRDGDIVRAYSRQLRDISHLVPTVLALGHRLAAQRFVLDGEVVAFDAAGRTVPFQDLMSDFARETLREDAPPLEALFFDVLLLNDDALVNDPYRDRRAVLERLVPESNRVASSVVSTEEEAERAFRNALALGHEGVVLKALDAPYSAGRRGAQWLKVKPAVTLDLVVLAAEWGHGRRRGFLSNLHLGARMPEEPGRFAMLGKTFKGLTDAMLRDMTTDLLAMETGRDGIVVHVRPERVVEVAFDAVQRSPHYDSGLALRFARVKRFRPDKQAEDATTLEEVRALRK